MHTSAEVARWKHASAAQAAGKAGLSAADLTGILQKVDELKKALADEPAAFGGNQTRAPSRTLHVNVRHHPWFPTEDVSA